VIDGGWKLITPPANEPLTEEEVKLQLRIDHSEEDELLRVYIQAARQSCEEETWRALLTQTWELQLPAWPLSREIELPKPPLQSVTSVKYTLQDGTVQTMSSSLYRVDTTSEPGRIVLVASASWPSDTLDVGLPIAIRFVAGYGSTATSVPAPLLQGMRLLVGTWYANRESVNVGNIVNELPFATAALWRRSQVRW